MTDEWQGLEAAGSAIPTATLDRDTRQFFERASRQFFGRTLADISRAESYDLLDRVVGEAEETCDQAARIAYGRPWAWLTAGEREWIGLELMQANSDRFVAIRADLRSSRSRWEAARESLRSMPDDENRLPWMAVWTAVGLEMNWL